MRRIRYTSSPGGPVRPEPEPKADVPVIKKRSKRKKKPAPEVFEAPLEKEPDAPEAESE